MGLFGMFGKKLEDKVKDAVSTIQSQNPGVKELHADVEGKVVTLHGRATDLAAKTRVMEEFNSLVSTDNTLNLIEVDEKPAAPPLETAAVEAPTETVHQVVSGDTLSGLAQTYYGNASLYMKIFEANKDILEDPNLIKVGQKLRIPE